jgi:hypothetical protein
MAVAGRGLRPLDVCFLSGGEEPDGRVVQVGASHRVSAFDVA